MKISRIMSKHLKKHLGLLTILYQAGKRDLTIVSVILCEMYFTNYFKRQSEYLAWILLTFVRSKRRHKLSVGIAQIQIKHWIQFNFMTDNISYHNLCTMQNPYINYELAS